MDSPILTSKEQLRRDVRARRRDFVKALTRDERDVLEAAIAARAAPFLAAAHIVASYAPMGQEVDPAACRAHARPRAHFGLPWFENRSAEMIFRAAGAAQVPGPFGTLQPASDADILSPDVLLVPLVAADIGCDRLGQGQGHFDRALAKLRAEKPVRAIGLAWDAQIVARLPTDSWDERLDAVVTPTRTLLANG